MSLICRVALILAVTANTVALANPTGLKCTPDGQQWVRIYIDIDAEEFLLFAFPDNGKEKVWIPLKNFRANSLSVTAEWTNTSRSLGDPSFKIDAVHTLTVDRTTLILHQTRQWQFDKAVPETLFSSQCEIADVGIDTKF